MPELHVAIYIESADHFTFVCCSCGWPPPGGPYVFTPRNAAQWRHEANARYREHLAEVGVDYDPNLVVEIPYALSFPELRSAPARRWWQRKRPLPPVPVWR